MSQIDMVAPLPRQSEQFNPNLFFSRTQCKLSEPPCTPEELSDDVLDNTSIPWEYVETALRRKSTVLELAAGFPLRVLLIVAFAFFFFPSTDASACFSVFGSVAYPFLYGEVAKFKDTFFFHNIVTPAQYGDFVMDVVLPVLADYQVPTGPNLLLGAMRMRTQRVVPESCKLYSSVVAQGVEERFQACYGPLSDEFEDVGVTKSLYNREESWRYATCNQLGGTTLRGHLRSYHCGGYYFDVPFWQPYNNATDPSTCTFESCASDPELLYIFSNPEYIKTSLSEFQNIYVGPRLSSGTPFIDDVATRMVVTELALYNPTLHIFSLVKLLAESGAGGSWKTSLTFRSLTIWDGTFTGHNGYAIFFTVYLVANIVLFAVQQIRKVRRDGFTATIVRLWTAVDVVIYALLLVCCALRFALFGQTNAAHVRLAEITYRNTYPSELDGLAGEQTAAIYINGVATILLFVSLLPYFGMEQRVARVIGSFLHYQNALVGVVLVSLVLLTAFALSGQQLLSAQLWDFRSVDSSFRTLFFIQLRQVDLNKVASAPGNRVEKIFFIYASVLMCLYIILGAFSGVARQAYEETLQAEPSTEPLWWVWRRFCTVITSPRMWVSWLLDFASGRSEANRLQEASLTLQRYRKAKYAVVLHVKEKRAHSVTHQDWQLAFVDALGPVSHPFGRPRDTSRGALYLQRPNGSLAGGGGEVPRASDVSTTALRKNGCPTLPQHSPSRSRKPAPFPAFLDDSEATASSGTIRGAFASASQERAIRKHLEWVEMTWRDLVFEYIRTQELSRTARRTKKEIEWMSRGVQDVIGEHLDLLAQFPSRLASLERQIVVLSSELVPTSLTSKVLSSNSKVANEDDEDDNTGTTQAEQRDVGA